ncbi:7956_t:CDS:2, partial [Dentiscutata heterogama]
MSPSKKKTSLRTKPLGLEKKRGREIQLKDKDVANTQAKSSTTSALGERMFFVSK